MITRRFEPLEGERIAAVFPPMERDIDGIWQRRMRLFSGRSLSASTLTLEQNERAGRLATAAQLLSWGVVDGLECGISIESAPVRKVFLELSSGLGIAPGGEQIVVPAPVRVELKQIPGLETAGAKIGVLVLEPAEARLLGNVEPTDQCDFDETKDAFSDWQLIDSCRIRFVPLPADIPVPAGSNARNQAAYAIFSREKGFAPGGTFPWDDLGLPIALISVDPLGSPVFLDRYSVVRDGGRPPRRTDLISGTGHAVLWQARLLQFSEHVAQTDFDPRAGKDGSQFFAQLPPAGLLPKQWFDLGFSSAIGFEFKQNFFPTQFQFSAAPVPLEQLDAAIEASASFDPISMNAAERVELLIPVPQVFFESELLLAEEIDSRFFDVLTEAVVRRGNWLGRRNVVRQSASTASKLLSGKNAEFPPKDPNQVDANEDVNPSPPVDPKDSPADLKKITEEHLAEFAKVLTRVFKDINLANQKGKELTELGVAIAAERLDLLADRADDLINIGFIRMQTDMYRLRQILLGGTTASRLATSSALAGIAEARTAVAQEEAINKVIEEMKANKQVVTSRLFRRVRIPTAADTMLIQEMEIADSDAQPAVPFGDEEGSVFSVSEVARRQAVFTRAAPPLSFAATFRPTPAASAVSLALSARSNIANQLIRERPREATFELIDPQRPRTPPAQVPREPDPTPIEVATPPVTGRQDIRTTTTELRINTAKGPEARDFALSSKYSIVNSLKVATGNIVNEANNSQVVLNLADIFGNVLIPGMGVFENNAWQFERDGQAERNLRRNNRLLKDLDTAAIGRILEEPDDKGIVDEAHFFFAAVDIVESGVAALRGAEFFVEGLRQAAVHCRNTATKVLNAISLFDDRLSTIEDEISEARQDTAVCRALIAEEQQRVALINERRKRILEEHVPFLCFRRPPTVSTLRDVPTRNVDTDVLTPPVPVCLSRNLTPPTELQKLVDLMREAPVLWFPKIEALLERLDRREHLRDAVRFAQERLIGKAGATLDDAVTLQATRGRFTKSISRVLIAQRDMTVRFRSVLPQIQPAALVNLTWRESREQVRRVLSIGDLIDGVGGRSDVSRLASQELDQIARVSACLHEKFTEVLPEIRLDWALRFSQYDDPVEFRDLSLLPRWQEMDYLDRHDLQTFADWLFEQVDRDSAEAMESVNNLIRTAILLASHAPVNRLLQGAVDESRDVQEGGSATVKFDESIMEHIRRGMEVHLIRQGAVVASAVIDDLANLRAQIRVTKNLTPGGGILKLDETILVQSVLRAEQTKAVRFLTQGTARRTDAVLGVVRGK